MRPLTLNGLKDRSARAAGWLPIVAAALVLTGCAQSDGKEFLDPPHVVALSVEPAEAEIDGEDSLQLRATAVWSDGRVTIPDVSWTSEAGLISTSGIYKPLVDQAEGAYRVKALHGDGAVSASSMVTVRWKPRLVGLSITPSVVAMAPNGTQQFNAVGRLSNGSNTPVAVTYTATGGSVTGSGLYTAGGVAGTYRVIARQQNGGLADTSVVTIAAPAPTLSQVLLTPPSVSLQVGGTQQFSASGKLSNGANTSVAVTYSATGGTISSAGLFTAGNTAGSYQVIAKQQGGSLADTSAVTITAAPPPPPPSLVQVVLSPATVSLQTGAAQQFSGSGKFSNGATASVSVTYTATGGTISAAGLYTAGSTPGTFRVIATQQGGSLADTSAVTITVAPPVLAQVLLTPASVSLQTGQTQQFSASGKLSNGASSPVTVTYTATGGTISTGGLYTAGTAAGTYQVIAKQQGGTLADTSAVTVTVPAPTLAQVLLTPASVSLQTGQTQQFSASGKLSNGASTTVNVTYAATGGTISSAGLFTAGNVAGTYSVVATQQGGTLADTSAVTVTAPAPTLAQILLTPTTAALQTGQTQQFSASGKLSNGASTPVNVTYTATGGTISAAGLYTAGNVAGTYQVIAKQQAGTLADTSVITLTAPAPTLAQVLLTPATASVQAGATQQFSASGKLSNGAATSVTVTYSATGGAISAGGLYTAGMTAGTYQVIAKQQGGTLADTSVVTVQPTSPPPSGGLANECATPKAGWLWCDDFEQNRLSSYFEVDNAGGNFTRTSGVGNDGSYGMKVHFNAGQVEGGALHLALGKTPSGFRPVDGGTAVYRELYWRVYLKHQAGWSGGGGDKLSRAIVFAGSNWTNAMKAPVWSGQGADANYLTVDPESSTDLAGNLLSTAYNDFAHQRYLGQTRSNTPIFDAAHVGRWYCIEAHARLNDAGQSNGVFEIWIDGQLEARKAAMNWVGSYSAYGMNAVFLESYWNAGSPKAQDRFMDNFVVSTAPIGCGQ